jgi:hypothetical protein
VGVTAAAFPNEDVDLVQRARWLQARIEREGHEIEIYRRVLEERIVRIGELLYVVAATTEELAAVAARIHD